MNKKIPISAAKKIATEHDQRQVILVCWDGQLTSVVTYGKTDEECDQAARGGNMVKLALGWPESLDSEPSRVKKLKSVIRLLVDTLENASESHNFHVDEEMLKNARKIST